MFITKFPTVLKNVHTIIPWTTCLRTITKTYFVANQKNGISKSLALIQSTAQPKTNADLLNKFQTASIVPDLIGQTPKQLLQVKYKNNVVVRIGAILTPSETLSAPTELQWTKLKSKLYTVCMFDPDLPSRTEPILRSFIIWLVCNIPGADQSTYKGDMLIKYSGIGPPKNTGYHRIILLVFEQTTKIDKNKYFSQIHTGGNGNSVKSRKMVDLEKLIQMLQLTKQPIAGTYFLAAYDNSVSEVYHFLNSSYKHPTGKF